MKHLDMNEDHAKKMTTILENQERTLENIETLLETGNEQHEEMLSHLEEIETKNGS